MSMPVPDSPNWGARLHRRIFKLETEFARFKSAIGTLASATISKGNLIIKDGGGLIIKDGGGLTIDGGWLVTTALGRVLSLASDSLSHLANGRVWVETPLNAENALAGGGPPKALLQTFGLTAYGLDESQWVAFTFTDGGIAKIWATSNQLQVPYTTTSSAANTRIEADGTIKMVTSSLRYKQDIEDAGIDPDLFLRLRPRTWRDKNAVAEDPDTTVRHIGFIAEEVEAAGGTVFVDHDAEGRPDALQYDRMLAAAWAHAVAQEARAIASDQRMADMEQTVADLTARVAALEAA